MPLPFSALPLRFRPVTYLAAGSFEKQYPDRMTYTHKRLRTGLGAQWVCRDVSECSPSLTLGGILNCTFADEASAPQWKEHA